MNQSIIGWEFDHEGSSLGIFTLRLRSESADDFDVALAGIRSHYAAEFHFLFQQSLSLGQGGFM